VSGGKEWGNTKKRDKHTNQMLGVMNAGEKISLFDSQ